MQKKRYEDDFETVITLDEKGNEKKTAVYRGDYYEIDLEEKGIVKFKRINVLLLILIIILHFVSGCIGNPGMYQFYIALPYVVAFFPLLYMAIAIFRLPNKKRNFRSDEIGLSFDRMKTTSFILITLLVLGILGEIVFLIFFSGKDQQMLEYLYLISEIQAAIAVFIIIIMEKQIKSSVCSEKGKQ